MNILFYNNIYPGDLLGGIERITSRLSEELARKGFKVYSLYTHEKKSDISLSWFEDDLYVPENDIPKKENEIINFVLSKKIDILINQFVWENDEMLWNLREKTGCKIVFVHHSLPYYEKSWVPFSSIFKNNQVQNTIRRSSLYTAYNLVASIKRRLLFKIEWDKKYDNIYQNMVEKSDIFVVLSKSFYPLFSRIKRSASGKVYSIGNMLSYDTFLQQERINIKCKTVLIVSRLEERTKKISVALRIWKKIEQIPDFADWSLQIVGEGPNIEDYKQYVQNNLQRATFYGKQEPKPFYEKASVFLMTSAYEGWGITLTEAQQFGCVPIALNTYSAAKDIITNKENGFLVDYEWQFIMRLKQLMRDSNMRFSMAKKAIESSHRFEKKRVTDIWIDLFNKL